MRNAFAAEMTELAERDPRVVLLMGDIGNRLFDDYKARTPERFLNAGVAEANMVGVAAGMAMCGLRPVVYTITPFVTTRCLEQIRVDVCYHHQPVTIVGVGAGLSYASLGATHHSLEDIAFLRAIPEMTVICPADANEVRAALRATRDHDGPVYMRMGKKGEPLVHDDVPEFEVGKGITLREGSDVCLLATGNIVPTALEAATLLEGRGLSVQVVSLHTVKPLDQQLLADAFSSKRVVATVEEHSTIGGLGSAVAEWLADRGTQQASLVRIGTGDWFLHEATEQEHARERYGIDAESIASRVAEGAERAPHNHGAPAAAGLGQAR
jgi:transketolase